MSSFSRLRKRFKERRFHFEFGLHFRNFIHRVVSAVYPYAKKVLPNFRAVHYFYILSCAIIGSILVYPVKTARYIDILFLTSGASTQAGLNTVNLVDLSLYQQIVLFFLASLTTPIFIHGSLLFVRLYYFERHFDNIKEKSKLDFKMRRSATLARTRSGTSMDSTRVNTNNNKGLGIYDHEKEADTSGSPQSSTSTNKHAGSADTNNDVEHMTEPSDDEKDVNERLNHRRGADEEEDVETYSAGQYNSHNNNNNSNKNNNNSNNNNNKNDTINNINSSSSKTQGIKFGALPHPPKRKKSIDPEDMLRSINMLQEKQKQKQKQNPHSIQFVNVSSPSRERREQADHSNYNNDDHHHHHHQMHSRSMDHEISSKHGEFSHDDVNNDDSNNNNNNNSNNDNNDSRIHHDDDDDDDDDVLIIKPPNEVEHFGSHNSIFTKKHNHSTLHFKEPIMKKKWLQGGVNARKHYRPWTSKLRKTFSNRRFSTASSDIEDDDASIDSEHDMSHRSEDDEDGGDEDEDEEDEAEDADDENDDDDDGLSDAHYEDEIAITEDDDDEEEEDDDDDEDRRRTGSSRHKVRSTSRTIHPTQSIGSNDVELGNIKYLNAKPARKSGKTKTPAGRRRKRRFDVKKIKTPSLYPSLSNHSGAIRPTNTSESTHSNGLSRTMSGNYLSWTPTVGRNSTFIKLTEEQKDELGGIEYRAVKLLIKIIVIYYLGFHIVPGIMFIIWVYCMPNYKKMLDGLSIVPAWWAFFTMSSSFNDLGFTLTPDSMSSFNQNAFVQVVSSFLIVIGNTGFPVFLRFIIWVLFKTARPLSLYKESLGFLLDHPRRCFTLLFPSLPTWWLFFILVVLNGFDLVIFCILDLRNAIFDGIPMGYRVLNGLFQAFCTRTSGLSIMDLSQLHAATLVSYMIMMYISVLPIAISVRRTNVYEEQSLGVYAPDEGTKEADEKVPANYVGAHLRNQLSYDLWYVFLGLFIICIAEGHRIQKQDIRFSVFPILFEIVSAYGTVGMSLGYPDSSTSLSGQFNVISKLVIIAMMIRGRHRGLPYAIDRAIMLPDADMRRHDRMQENHALKRHQTMERTGTLGRVATMTGNPMDGGHNLLTRVLTNVNDFIDARRRNSAAQSNFDEPSDSSEENSIHSVDPHYHVTTVDHV